MSNLKQKISYKVMALCLVVLMVVGMIPATVISYALDSVSENQFEAKNFTAVYNAETDTVDMTWDAFETQPYELWLCVNTVKTTKLDVTATSCSYSTSSGGTSDYSLRAFANEEDTEGVETDAISVISAYTFKSVPAFDAVEVDNNLTIAEIVEKLPTETKVNISDVDGLASNGHTVSWNTEGTTYDQTKSEEQVITVSGTVALNTNNVQNRNNLPLDCSIQVTVKAAVDVSISSNLDDTTPADKKVGEGLTLSVEAAGTLPTYQWYKLSEGETEGTAIDGAASATLNITSLTLADAAQYYCVVTGKNGTVATSKVATVNVEKNPTSVDLSIDPEGSQTRPQSITLEAVGIPEDATGKVIFKEGENILEEITLPSNDIKTTFKAYGPNNEYDFTVIYDALDDTKYLGSEKAVNDYGFNKADQTVEFKADTIPSSEITYAEGENFTVEAEKSQTGKYEYAIIDEKDADGEVVSEFVAKINKDTGLVTILAPGTFKITVKAIADDDYNESPVVTSNEITITRAAQGDFEFATGEATVTYFHGFNYLRNFAASGTGSGEITYELGSTTTAEGVVVNPTTGEITFLNAENDNDANFSGKVGVVEVIATKAQDKWVNAKSTSYTITIEKAQQSVFKFDVETPDAITYTENNGTTFTNAISSDDEKNGWVNVNNAPVYSVDLEKTLDGDEIETASDVVAIDAATGTITAKRSGVVTIKATLAGNGVYDLIETTYIITVNRGTIEIADNGDDTAKGFNFDVADSEIKYGFIGFENVAAGGQEDSNSTVIYTEDSAEISVSDNGIITFDKVPAEAATETYTVTITATKPQTDKYNECSITYTLTVSRDAVDFENDFRVNGEVIKDATKSTSPDGWYNAEHTSVSVTPYGEYNEISIDGINWVESIECVPNAINNISFFLKKADGSTTLVSKQTVNYDTTKATATLTYDEDTFWDKFLETITFGLWKNESKEITINANDNLSGIMSIEYYEENANFKDTSENPTFAEIEELVKDFDWKPCDITCDGTSASSVVKVELEALSNKKVVIYAKVTDYAGNVQYFRTDGMVFDSITPDQDTVLPDPIINITLKDNTNEGLYNGEVPFTLTVNDEQTNSIASGIKDITVTIKGSAAEKYEKIIKIEAKDSEISSFNSDKVDADQFTVNGTFTVPADFDSNYLTINVVVNDYAGNTYNNEVPTHLAIDVTKPIINVSYNDKEDTFSNGKYIGNDKNRVATIDITELNFVNSAVVIKVTKDGKALNIQPNFKAIEGKVDENGDQIGWRMTIDYATLGEGDFTFDVAYTDKAKNANNGWACENQNAKSFTIDNTKPVINVVISNSNVKNDKYFAADRTATVTITERNFSKDYKFDWSGLTLSLDGEPLTAPTPVLTKSNDGTYERVYTIDFSVEGDYTFDVKYTDLADNYADTYSCSSVAYKEFTVDKTAPALSITGVADKSANNGDVAPVISYSDINFTKDTVSISLSGVNLGKVNYTGSFANAADGHGQTYTYADFEKIQEVDDIYTLTAKLTDMAGNLSEKTITFSANRFGSVYDISAVKDLIGKYMHNEQVITFTETNVDSLEREGIKLKVVRNGKPTDLVEGTDYTVEVTGGDGQWSVYKYTLDKKLFANDGRYSVTVYSVDAAGNVNENIDETKEAEISFGIDKTKPVIVPVDLENGTQYALDVKTATIEIKDNLVLDGVKIYLNGKEVDYVVEGETYTFPIANDSSEQVVKVVAIDAAGNEQPLEIKDILVSADFFVRFLNDTTLMISSIVGVIVLGFAIWGLVILIIKRRRYKKGL